MSSSVKLKAHVWGKIIIIIIYVCMYFSLCQERMDTHVVCRCVLLLILRFASQGRLLCSLRSVEGANECYQKCQTRSVRNDVRTAVLTTVSFLKFSAAHNLKRNIKPGGWEKKLPA